MYNLKVEAVKIIETLQENGFDACFVKEYPFVRYNNNVNPQHKLRAKQIEIVTNAEKSDLQKLFKVSNIENEYNKSLIVDVEVKGNIIHFRIFYKEDYKNVINNNVIKINSITDIVNNFGFLNETLIMDKEMNIINYINKKNNSYDSIKDRMILSNGNFREKVLESPIRIFQFINYACITNYEVNDSYFKIILNNNKYLKYEKLSLIVSYLNRILLSKNCSRGLKYIRDYISDLDYNGVEIFKFLKNYDDEYLEKIDNFDNSVDLISRWGYLLIKLDNYEEVLNNLQIKNKENVLWLIKNYSVIEDKKDNFKMAIYDAKDSLKIVNEKYDAFTLYDNFNRLMKLKSKLFIENIDLYNKVIDTICSRPFFKYQLRYTDEYICKTANIEKGKWLEITKEDLLKKIIMSNKHPKEDEYLELLKESIEYGLLSE